MGKISFIFNLMYQMIGVLLGNQWFQLIRKEMGGNMKKNLNQNISLMQENIMNMVKERNTNKNIRKVSTVDQESMLNIRKKVQKNLNNNKNSKKRRMRGINYNFLNHLKIRKI